MTNLLQRAREEGNPLIDSGSATFIWQETGGLENSGVHLISDLHRWEEAPQPLKKSGPRTRALTIDLPHDTYLEYAFYDPVRKERFADPLNKHKVFNGIGSYNHFFYMPGAEPTPYVKLPQAGLRGTITRHTLQVDYPFTFKKSRRVYLYHPPVQTAVPLLIIYDGLDYFHRGRLANIVDNLIAAGLIQPLALAFLQNGGSRARFLEYDCSDLTISYLKQYIIPLAERELNLLDHTQHPGVHGILGSSMGGRMAAFTALRAQEIFGRAICQAGAYQYFDGEAVLMDMVRHMPRTGVRFWLDCGRLDFLLEASRNFAALLEEKRCAYIYKENGGAHNQTTWRNAAAEALQHLFPA